MIYLYSFFFLSIIQVYAAELMTLPNELIKEILKQPIVNMSSASNGINAKNESNVNDVIQCYQVSKEMSRPIALTCKKIYRLSRQIIEQYERKYISQKLEPLFGELIKQDAIDVKIVKWFYVHYHSRIADINDAIWFCKNPDTNREYEGETYFTAVFKETVWHADRQGAIQKLLLLGAKASVTNRKGEMPIDLAFCCGGMFSSSLTRLLKENGGDPENYYEIYDYDDHGFCVTQHKAYRQEFHWSNRHNWR